MADLDRAFVGNYNEDLDRAMWLRLARVHHLEDLWRATADHRLFPNRTDAQRIARECAAELATLKEVD